MYSKYKYYGMEMYGMLFPRPQVLAVLTACIRELKYNRLKMANPGPKDDVEVIVEEYELNITTALYLCTIITKLLNSETVKASKADKNLSFQLIFSLNQMNLKLRDGQTLLHLAVNGITPVDDFHTSDVCRFPCVDTVKLLLDCGALISVVDCSRNSPLHTLTATVSPAGPSLLIKIKKNHCMSDDGVMPGQIGYDDCDSDMADLSQTPEMFNGSAGTGPSHVEHFKVCRRRAQTIP